jgi:copper resistance protein B
MRLFTALLAGLLVGWVALPATAQHDAGAEPRHGDVIAWKVLAEQLELVATGDGSAASWEVQGWVGGDYDRLWLKFEGDDGAPDDGDFEVQALYSRLIAPYWDLQAGVRYDRTLAQGPVRQRAHLVVGLEGLAPYWFEVEPALFVSDDGDVSARLEASVDLLITQRLVLQPNVEINVAAQSVEEWGIGSGLNDLEMALRLRYEIRPEVAPSLGVQWKGLFGETGDLAEQRAEPRRATTFLVGLRAWF